MCLGVPGKVIEIEQQAPGMLMGKATFGGIIKTVCLSYVPDVCVGEYVIVHVGFAISKVDEQEAAQVFAYLRAMDDLRELDVPQPD